MKIIRTTVEPVDDTTIRVVTLVDISGGNVDEPPDGQIGEGPTGNAVPDRIVQFLINNGGSASLAEIQRAVGGNAGTVNRQAWTLASNAPDLQVRLRGWVMNAGRGQYALTPEARRKAGLAPSRAQGR